MRTNSGDKESLLVEHCEEKPAQPQLFQFLSQPIMQSLLSQSESNAFQSFLSSMDYTADAIPVDEWAAFSASSASMELSYPEEVEDRQALTKATKDLMSLDTDVSWDDPNDTSMMNHSPIIHPHFDDHETHQTQTHRTQHLQHRYQQESHGVNSYPSRHDSFPFLYTKSHKQQQSQPIQFPIHPVSPVRTASPDLQQCSPHSPHSPYGFSQKQQLHPVHMPQQAQQQHTRETCTGTRPKRSHTLPSTSPSPSFARPSSDSPHKRQRLSSSDICPPAAAPAAFSSPDHSSSNRSRQQQASKPNLLSVSQKKANHIQSEQKRRANIRKGYAALCETVPALREAIREEEEAERNAAVHPNITPVVNGVGAGAEVKTNGAGKKRRSKKGAIVNGKDLDDRDKDKIDGRAGPRSENIVLSKSMDIFFLPGFL